MTIVDSAVSFMGTLVNENGQFWASAATEEQLADALAVLRLMLPLDSERDGFR